MKPLRPPLGIVPLLLVTGSIALAQTQLPRYSLPVGRQLTYSALSHFKYKGGAFDSVADDQITVVAHNPDGSIRVIVRSGEREIQSRDGSPPNPDNAEPENITYTQLDITPDGRLISAQGGFAPDSPMVLPLLPADQNEFTATWKKESVIPGETTIFTSAGPIADGKWDFKSTTEGLFKTVYGIVNDITYHFDTAKGLVVAIDMQSRQDYGFTGSGSGSTHLTSDKMLSPQAVTLLAHDVSELLSAHDRYVKTLRTLASPSADHLRVAADARTILSTAAAAVSSRDVQAQLNQSLLSVDQAVQETLDEDKRSAAIKDKPAPDFTAPDIDGNRHTLRDFRGKIVVLDFWYRGCGWCMRAMPQVNQVADDFRSKPVVILGLNTDSDIADPKFVIGALKLNYPVLRIDQNVVTQFQVQAFPSLLVLDSKGIVREFDEGYSLTLRVDLDKKINALLSDAK
jgi:peroxiredoxin